MEIVLKASTLHPLHRVYHSRRTDFWMFVIHRMYNNTAFRNVETRI